MVRTMDATASFQELRLLGNPREGDLGADIAGLGPRHDAELQRIGAVAPVDVSLRDPSADRLFACRGRIDIYQSRRGLCASRRALSVGRT